MGSISLVLSNSHILLLLKGFTPPQSETGMANNKRLDNIQLQRLFLHSTGIQLLELLPTASKSLWSINTFNFLATVRPSRSVTWGSKAYNGWIEKANICSGILDIHTVHLNGFFDYSSILCEKLKQAYRQVPGQRNADQIPIKWVAAAAGKQSKIDRSQFLTPRPRKE